MMQWRKNLSKLYIEIDIHITFYDSRLLDSQFIRKLMSVYRFTNSCILFSGAVKRNVTRAEFFRFTVNPQCLKKQKVSRNVAIENHIGEISHINQVCLACIVTV